MPNLINQCNGSCCGAFTIGKHTIKSLKQSTKNWKDDNKTFISLLYVVRHEEGFDSFSCVRFNKETKLCTAYKHRPPICSDYPYDSVCTFPGCGYTNACEGAD